jgi:hypothetical protein
MSTPSDSETSQLFASGKSPPSLNSTIQLESSCSNALPTGSSVIALASASTSQAHSIIKYSRRAKSPSSSAIKTGSLLFPVTNAQTSTPTDTSKQLPPLGFVPRVTGCFWKSERCLYLQVEVRGIYVTRREDNNLVNGTKLLNVAGISKYRRTVILRGEKTRHVVSLGPMHLRGVWYVNVL